MVGEVFLDKLLLDRLRLLRATPSITRVSAITNATMAHLYSDEELAEILSHFDHLAVSVYGLDPEEFLVMTRKDRYELFMTGLARLLKFAGPAKLSLGARHLKDRTQGETDRWLDEVARRAGVAGGEIRFAGTKTYGNWSFFDIGAPLPFDATWIPISQNTKQCVLPLISIQILSDGRVSFCGCANYDGASELTLGTIREESLADLLGSERVSLLWNWPAHGTPEFCKTCTFHVPVENLVALPGAFSDPFGTFGG
jgi:hypothetical protein